MALPSREVGVEGVMWEVECVLAAFAWASDKRASERPEQLAPFFGLTEAELRAAEKAHHEQSPARETAWSAADSAAFVWLREEFFRLGGWDGAPDRLVALAERGGAVYRSGGAPCVHGTG